MATQVPRTGTPPRSGTAAPIRILRICLDEHVLGAIDINESSTLADVRKSIAEDQIHGVPENYVFLFREAPVSLRQEGRRRAVDCHPFLTIIPEGAYVPAQSSQGISDVPEPSNGATPLASEAHLNGPSQPSGLPVAPTASAAQIGVVPPSSTEVGAVGTAADTGPTEEPGEEALVMGGATLELQITDGPLEGTTVTVGEEGARIGRHTSNALVIPEAGISRYHCEICFIDGNFCIRDLGSTTGTFFYLRPHSSFQMFVGLMVKLGETEMQVLCQEPNSNEGPKQVVLFYEGPLAGRKLHVPSTGISIGRRHNNHVVLVQDGTVSAHHAMVFFEDGHFHITDLASCNGTCVRLSPERSESDWHPILDGDVLGAGCTKVRCRVHLS